MDELRSAAQSEVPVLERKLKELVDHAPFVHVTKYEYYLDVLEDNLADYCTVLTVLQTLPRLTLQ
jgi:uncharacterized protein YqiB (DUF1249 family)